MASYAPVCVRACCINPRNLVYMYMHKVLIDNFIFVKPGVHVHDLSYGVCRTARCDFLPLRQNNVHVCDKSDAAFICTAVT